MPGAKTVSFEGPILFKCKDREDREEAQRFWEGSPLLLVGIWQGSVRLSRTSCYDSTPLTEGR